MISARMRHDLEEYAATHSESNATPDPQDDGAPSLVFAAICVVLSVAIAFWSLYRLIEFVTR